MWLQRAPKSPEKNINALMGGESTMEVSIPLIMPRSHVRGAGLEKAPGCRLVSAPGRSEQPEKQRKNKQKSQSKWAELIRCFCLVNDSHCRANGVLTIGEEVIEEKGLTGFLTYKLVSRSIWSSWLLSNGGCEASVTCWRSPTPKTRTARPDNSRVGS